MDLLDDHGDHGDHVRREGDETIHPTSSQLFTGAKQPWTGCFE